MAVRRLGSKTTILQANFGLESVRCRKSYAGSGAAAQEDLGVSENKEPKYGTLNK